MTETILDIDELTARYELSNRADGKSPKTVGWYTAMLTAFSGYMKTHFHSFNITDFTPPVASSVDVAVAPVPTPPMATVGADV